MQNAETFAEEITPNQTQTRLGNIPTWSHVTLVLV